MVPRRLLELDLAEGLQLGHLQSVELRVGRRQLRVESLEGVDQQLGDGEVAYPVVVGGDDVPCRPVGRRLVDRVFVRRGEVIPQLAVVEVAQPELPALLRVVETLL